MEGLPALRLAPGVATGSRGCVLCDLLLSARQASGDEVGVGLTQLLLVDEKRDIVLDLLDDVSDVSC